MVGTRTRHLVLGALCLLLCLPILAQDGDLEVQVSVQPRTLREGESLRVTIATSGSEASSAEITSRAVKTEKLTPLGSFSSSHQVSWINGVMNATKTFQIEYLATAAGDTRLPVFTIKTKKKTYRTKPVQVKILARGAASKAGSDDGGLSIRAALSRKRVYLGESLVLEYILRSQVNIRGYDPQQLEQIPGFLVTEVELSPESTAKSFTDKDGNSGTEYVLFRRILVPTRLGKIEIPSAIFTFGVQSNQRDRRSFFFEPRVDRVARFVPARTLEVLPLPEEGRPADFTGAVGRFKLEASMGSDEVAAGEAVNLIVSLRGSGVLGTVSPPHLSLPPDVQSYDPLEETRPDGSRRWVFPLVPRTPGQLEIEGVHMSTFDSASRSYSTLSAGPFALMVTPGRGGEGRDLAGGVGGALPVRQQATDLRFVHSAPSDLFDWNSTSFVSPIVWVMALAPPLLLPLLIVGRGLSQRFAKSSSGRRLRNARRVAAFLRDAERHAVGNPEEAARDILRAVHAWAEELLEQPSRPLERGQLRRALIEKLGEADRADRVVNLIDRAEGVRYGGPSQADTIAGLIEEGRTQLTGRDQR